MKIYKKILPEYFQKILEGTKKHEVRLADWECNEGDVLVLQEVDSDTKELTGREIEKEVRSVWRTKDGSFWPKEEVEEYGYQIISFD